MSGDVWRSFWDHVARGIIAIPVCLDCRRANWYPSHRCRSCGGEAFEWEQLSGSATVFVSLWSFRDFAGEGREVPYAVALVCPVEHPGVRLLASVTDAHLPADGTSQPPIESGTRVQLEAVTSASGSIVVARPRRDEADA